MGVLKKLHDALGGSKSPPSHPSPLPGQPDQRHPSGPKASGRLQEDRRRSLHGASSNHPGGQGDTRPALAASASDPALSPASSPSLLVTPPTPSGTLPLPSVLYPSPSAAAPAFTRAVSDPTPSEPASAAWAEMAAGAASYVYRRPASHPDATWAEVRRMEQAALESEDRGVPLLVYEPRLQKYAKVPGRVYSDEGARESLV
ncbi:hypothetical protein Q5752_002994 [Cryptotrichosporon argae]